MTTSIRPSTGANRSRIWKFDLGTIVEIPPLMARLEDAFGGDEQRLRFALADALDHHRAGNWSTTPKSDRILNQRVLASLSSGSHWIVGRFRVMGITVQIATAPDRQTTVIRLYDPTVRRIRR